jgi:hypothetical protein
MAITGAGSVRLSAAVGALARSTDTALMLLAGIDASFDFNDYAQHHVAAQPFASLNPDLLHFRVGNFLTSSVIIGFPVSGNKLRAHSK